MLEYRTPGFKGFSTKYSPFFDSRLAVAAGQNFGLVGNGRLYVLGLTARGIVEEKCFETQDVLYDLAWSELHENQVVVATGDGSVKLFDLNVDKFPIQSWAEHSREVFSVHWNLVAKDVFLSSSWDGCIKIYNPERDQSLYTLPTHSCTYSAQFSPHENGIISAVSSDNRVRIFDLRTRPGPKNHLVMTIPIGAEAHEALTHDWNKYRNTVIATGGVDRTVRTFDLRNPTSPLTVLSGHEYAVRKLSWSPHLSDLLLSASYDMTCRVWSDGTKDTAGERGVMDKHTEFCTGVDWCLFGAEGWCTTTAWDERVLCWDVRNVMR